MVRPDLLQLCSNPLVLSMAISHIRSASKTQSSGVLNRWRLYHASYSMENGNPNATRADYGYKQAIGMYTFLWDDA